MLRRQTLFHNLDVCMWMAFRWLPGVMYGLEWLRSSCWCFGCRGWGQKHLQSFLLIQQLQKAAMLGFESVAYWIESMTGQDHGTKWHVGETALVHLPNWNVNERWETSNCKVPGSYLMPTEGSGGWYWKWFEKQSVFDAIDGRGFEWSLPAVLSVFPVQPWTRLHI